MSYEWGQNGVKSALDSPYNAISFRHLLKSKTYYFLDPKHESRADPFMTPLQYCQSFQVSCETTQDDLWVRLDTFFSASPALAFCWI